MNIREGITSNYQTITVTKLSPHIGAEIGNIDLTKPLSELQVTELHQAFADHLVIFFRDQKISFDDQIRLAEHFGELGRHVGVSTISKPTEHPQVRRDAWLRDAELALDDGGEGAGCAVLVG